MKKVLLCVTGSISAYKAPSIANILKKEGFEVKVIVSEGAKMFITKLAFSAQGHPTYENKDEINYNGVLHIDLINWADIVLIAPASANTISKIANGITDDLLSSVLRAFPWQKKDLIICPAMNTDMYLNPITEEQISKLNSMGKDKFHFVNPQEKTLACGVTGIGALAKLSDIIKKVKEIK